MPPGSPAASAALVVTEPTLSGEHDMVRVLQVARHFKVPAAVCLNKWDLNPDMAGRIESAASGLGAWTAGRVRYDRGVTGAQIQARAVVETDAASRDDIFPGFQEARMDGYEEQAGTGDEHGPCGGGERAGCGAGEDDPQAIDQRRVNRRMGRVAHKILVLSGKGGVGKSTVAVNLALSLALDGKRVGILDVDIHGPSVPRMLGLEGQTVLTEGDVMLPVERGSLKVMSIGFLLRGPEEAVIWRGPMKMAVIKQFLTDVEWGDLDYLVVDAPPGTGDEPLSVCQLIENPDGAVVVTTPQEVALAAVRRSITFCGKLGVPVLGVVENMSGFVCPRCGELADVFGAGGGERLAKEMAVPFLGRIPLDPILSTSGDAGSPCVQEHAATATGRAFAEVIRSIMGHEAVPGQPLEHHEKRPCA